MNVAGADIIDDSGFEREKVGIIAAPAGGSVVRLFEALKGHLRSLDITAGHAVMQHHCVPEELRYGDGFDRLQVPYELGLPACPDLRIFQDIGNRLFHKR